MGHYSQEPGTVAATDREAFVRENAVALLADRDALVRRLRREVRRLERSRADLRRLARSLADRVAGQAELLARRAEGGG